MPAPADQPPAAVHAVEELLRMLAKGQRALQMYLPNNPVYQKTLQQVTDAFVPVWDNTDRLVLEVHEDRIVWEGAPVLRADGRGEGLPWQLYKDGLRQLTLSPGAEAEEVFGFLRVVNRARMLPSDSIDDLLTLMWEQEFALISYAFVEVSGDATEFVIERPARAEASRATGQGGSARDEVREARAADAKQGSGGSGLVDLADFDATLYFLDESETRFIQSELDEEYRRDIQQAAIDALLDVFESQRDPAVRREVIELLDDILPAQLATGGFRVVARILRELRAIAVRAPGLDPELQAAVLSFEERLSTAEILQQLFRVLADTAERPDQEDVGEVLRELRPTALPVVLAQLARITDPNARRTLESSVDAIARTQPDALAAVIADSPDGALIPALAVAGRLGLSQLAPAIIAHLQTGDEAVRLAAVRTLGELSTPTAVTAIEGALGDSERSVRQAALQLLLARGGSGGLAARLETMLFSGAEQDWERSERRSLFEAYGTLAGPGAVARLADLLEPRGVFRRKVAPDVRASALFALARIRTPEARAVAERFTNDKEPVVRSAANAALREWA